MMEATIIDKRKATVIRTHPIEIFVIALILAVSSLAWWTYKTNAKVESLNTEMKNYLYQDRQEMIRVLDKSNSIVDKNTDILTELKFIIKEKQ